jgi:hypothetical protein
MLYVIAKWYHMFVENDDDTQTILAVLPEKSWKYCEYAHVLIYYLFLVDCMWLDDLFLNFVWLQAQ